MARTMGMLAVVLLLVLPGTSLATSGKTALQVHNTVIPQALRQAEHLARELTLTTGVAVSPLLGVVLLGAGRYYTAAEAERRRLPWHASPRFWGPAALLLSLLFLKDSSKVALPKLLIIPLDALETLLEKNFSGLLALPVLLSAFSGGDFAPLHALGGQAADFVVPVAWAGEPTVATGPGLHIAMLSAVAAFAIYVAVWVCAQACNVLILLSPSSLLDTVLTVAKTFIAVLLLSLAGTVPGHLLALSLVVLALFLFPRALRLVVFGTLVSHDLVRHRLLGRPTTPPLPNQPLRCFTSCRLGPIPSLTCGRIDVQEGVLAFSWRPLMVAPKRTLHTEIDPTACSLARGFLSPVLWWDNGTEAVRVQIFRLLPATAAHLDLLADQLGVTVLEDSSVRARLAEGWRWCRTLFVPTPAIPVDQERWG